MKTGIHFYYNAILEPFFLVYFCLLCLETGSYFTARPQIHSVTQAGFELMVMLLHTPM